MKKTTLFKSMLLLCALIVGSGSLWATEESLEITISNFTEITTSYTTTYTHNYTVGGNTFPVTAYGVYKNGGIQMNSGKSTYIKNTVAFPGYITRIVATWSASGKNSPTIYANSGSIASTSSTKLGKGSNSVTTQTYTVTDAATKNFNYFYFDGTTVTGACIMTSLKIYYEPASGEATTTSISDSEITNTNFFVGTAAGTLTAAVTYGDPATNVPGAAVTWSSSDEDVATVGSTTGVVTLVGAGTTTITASYSGVDNEFLPSSDTYELIVTNEDPNAITLWSEDFSAYSESDVPSGGTYGYVCQDGATKTQIYDANNAGGTAPELLVNKTGGYFEATVPLNNIKGDLKLKFKSNAYSITISTSTDGISVSGTSSFSDAGEHTVTFTGVTTNKTSVTIKFAAGSSNVRIDDIVLKGSKVIPVTVGKNGYTTFASTYGLDLTDANRPAGLKAYKATRSGANITFTALNQTVAAGTGLLLLGANDGSYEIPYVASGTVVDGNALVGVTSATSKQSDPSGNYYFVMKKATSSSDALAFAPLSTSAAVTIPAGKAYIEVPNSAFSDGAHDLTFGFEDTGATGICSVENDELQIENAKIYNLAGQRVAQPTKGLYIVNGKKVIVK